MSVPALARNDGDGDRFYTWGDERFYSVTTIIAGGIPKFLVPWASKAVAELVHSDLAAAPPHSRARAAIRRWAKAGRADVLARQAAGELTSIKVRQLTDVDFALRWLKGQPDRIRDAAAELGRDFHDEAELHVLRLANATGIAVAAGEDAPTWPEDLAGHRASFLQWLDDWQPAFLATEASVFNRTQAYAGTLDAIVTIEAWRLAASLARKGAPIPAWLIALPSEARISIVVDYKSGRDTYPEVGLQLAALARGEFVGLPDGRTTAPVPLVHAGAVLHVTPKRYRFRLVRIDEPIYRAFLHARETFRFRKDLAPTVFLADLELGAEEAA